MIPFGLVTLSAYLLTQIGFTRAWLSVDRGRWVPPITGVVVTAGVVAVALISAAFAGIEVGVDAVAVRVQPSLLGLLMIGAGPWLLARWVVRSAFVRNLLWGVLSLQVLTAVVLLIPALAQVADDRSTGALEGVVAFVSVLVLGIAYGANLVILFLWLPFLGAVGIGGTLGTIVGLAGETTDLGFLELASEAPWLWIAPPITLAGLLLAAWLQPPAEHRLALYRQLRQSAGALLAFSLPTLWAGRVMARASGDVADEFGDEAAFLLGGGRRISGSIDAQLDVTLGAVGMPFRLVPALVLWTVIVGVVMFLAAQANGATWADPAAVAQDTRATGGRLLNRVRAATQAAQAAATTEGQAGPPVGQAGPPVGQTGPPVGQTGPPAWQAGPPVGQAGPPAEWGQQPTSGQAGPPVGQAGPPVGQAGPPVGQAGPPAEWGQQPTSGGALPASAPGDGWTPPEHAAPPRPPDAPTQPLGHDTPIPSSDELGPIEDLDALPPPTIEDRRPD